MEQALISKEQDYKAKEAANKIDFLNRMQEQQTNLDNQRDENRRLQGELDNKSNGSQTSTRMNLMMSQMRTQQTELAERLAAAETRLLEKESGSSTGQVSQIDRKINKKNNPVHFKLNDNDEDEEEQEQTEEEDEFCFCCCP